MARRMMIFGCSIAQGFWDKEGGWANRLRKHLDKRSLASGLNKTFHIYNLGISGQTLDKLNERFEDEAKRRIRERNDIIIFAVGINDTKMPSGKKTTYLSVKHFKDYINSLIKKAKKMSDNTLFLGLTPVNESKTNPWRTGETWKNKYIEKFDRIINSACVQNNIKFIEIYNEFTKNNQKELLEDGVHPNSKGHEKIYKIVKKYLEDKGYI